MNLGLAGQTVVVLGAASGIGRAIAAEFVAEGAQVAIVDRAATIVQTAETLATEAMPVQPFVADVTDYTALQQVATEIEQKVGPVIHVVFAVGIGSGKYGFPFWNMEPADWGKVLEVNLMGAVHTAYAFTPAMRTRKNGSLLFLSSVAGQIGSQTDPPYSASKAALINFSQCCAKDLADYNIRVNTLNPGMVNTPLNESIWRASNANLPVDQQLTFNEWSSQKIGRIVPLKRWQEPEDLAAMAVFLASARANNITGQTVNVDGGFVMHW
ncbi:MAG: SDR family oxidoreductase [Caldilineaceae bacterium]|nr:SDR family oxidoreductase [Caldilineaceae bacterium]